MSARFELQRMRRPGPFLIALGASLAMLMSALAEDSSDLFLRAYKDFQAGEKLEREAKPQEALKKYRSAQQVLKQLGKSAPEWQPLVVEYRLRKVQESVTRLETQLASTPATAPEGDLPETGGKVRPDSPGGEGQSAFDSPALARSGGAQRAS